MNNIELLVFLLMGILIALSQVSVTRKLKEIGKTKIWPNQLMILAANVLIAFGLLWAVSSLMEHETQAAMMGVLIFSGSGILVAILSYRIIARQR